jgi:hypothetical protein
MRRAVAIGLLMLGSLLAVASVSPAQPVTPPPTTTSPAPATSTSTRPNVVTAGGGGDRLPTLGEGFPWIGVGAVILIAGLAGARLRRASRR